MIPGFTCEVDAYRNLLLRASALTAAKKGEFPGGDHVDVGNKGNAGILDEPELSTASIVARMERLPITWWQIRARIIIGTATFFDAFDLLAIASALPVLIPLWKLKPTEIGFLISAGFIGQLAGVFFFGWLAERKGRLRALILSVALFSITSLACGMAWDYWSLLIFRTIQGIGLAGEVPIAASYISELAKAHKRGRFFLLYEMIFGVGLTAAGLVGAWIVPSFGWRPMFLFGALPALLILPLWRLMPKSPRWLASQGRLAEADRNVREIEDYIRGRGITLPPWKAIDLPPPPQEKTSALELFRQLYRRRTLLAWSIMVCTYSRFSALPRGCRQSIAPSSSSISRRPCCLPPQTALPASAPASWWPS